MLAEELVEGVLAEEPQKEEHLVGEGLQKEAEQEVGESRQGEDLCHHHPVLPWPLRLNQLRLHEEEKLEGTNESLEME